MIDVGDTLIKNNFDVKKTSKQLDIGESLIKRHLEKAKLKMITQKKVTTQNVTEEICVTKEVECNNQDPKKALSWLREKQPKKVETKPEVKVIKSKKINYFNKKIGEIKYFASNEERLEHADNIINRDWL